MARGRLTAARIREELEPVAELDWITALRGTETRQLEATERELDKVVQATRRAKRPLCG